MVRLDVQDDLHGGIEGQEAVGVLTGFQQEVFVSSDADIPVDQGKHAADGDGGILIRLHHDMGQHGRGRGLPVGAADGDAVFITCHDLAQELCPGHHGDAFFLTCPVLRVLRPDRRGKDRAVDIVRDVFPALSVKHLRADSAQMLSEFASRGIASADAESLFQEDLRQAAHTDAADTAEIHVTGVAVIKLVCCHTRLLITYYNIFRTS